MIPVEQIKAAASQRWPDILADVGGIDRTILDGHHHACPKCGGSDRFRFVDENAGACLCNKCFSSKNGDGIAAVMWAADCTFPDALKRIANHLGLQNGHSGNGRASDIVADVAQRKRIPVESLRAYGAHKAERGKLSVCRVPMFDETGAECSYFDLATIDDKWSKGLAAKSKPSGLFLADGKLPTAGDSVLIVEGCKDAAALHAMGFLAVGIPTCKLSAKFARVFRGCDVTIIPDRDVGGTDGAELTAARLAGVASSVKVAALPADLKSSGGADVRDILAKPDGESLVRRAIEDAQEWKPKRSDPADRVRIEVTPEQHIVIAETINALADDPSIYKRGDALVHVVRERTDTEDDGIKRTAGTPRIREVSLGLLRERLSAGCWFFKMVERGDDIQDQHVAPPGFAIQSIHSRGFWEPLRLLSGIVETPVLRPDGTIVNSPGWDEQTGLLYEPGDVLLTIPENPNRSDAIAARDALLDLVTDFPFSQETHRAAWLGALLTVLSRRAFSGPAPLFLIDGNVRGSGKSLLTDVIAIITTGRGMPRFSNPRDDDEARKRITSLAIAGDPLVLIDNIGSTLGSASLDAALTSTVWKDRKLGVNEIVECSLRAVWFATGNNVVLLADTSRRVCHVRLESPEESPEERTGFRHPNLLQHVRDNRLKLLTAGLTILRAFVVAGRPDAGLKPWGSFEGWSDLVRNCIAWLDLPDPGETRRELAEASDRDAAALRAIFAGWSEVDSDGEGLTSAALVKLLKSNDEHYGTVRDALSELCDTGKGLTGRAVGNQLRRFKGRVIGGQRLEQLPKRKGLHRWRVSGVGGVCGASGASVFPPSRASLEVPYGGGGNPDAISDECRTHASHASDTPRAVCSRCEGVLDSDGQCPACREW